MRRLLVVLMVFSGAAFAQSEEFSLPAFQEQAPDAGLPDPSAPPLPPLATVAPPPGPPKPPPAPSWARLGGATSVLFSGLQSYSFSIELALLVLVVGTPEHSPTVPGEVEGFLFQAGVEGVYGWVGGPLCQGTTFCAKRGAGGVALKGGWARGLPNVRDGVARAQTMYFGQLDVLASNYDIESAPLAPGVNTWELLTRLRLGLHFTSEAARATFTGVTLFGAAFIEAIPVSNATRGITLGGCLGIGF
ncbi:MAG: hypothetical protein Q8K32_19360 [Archangium sp.]|nr:hypothetical protein [Archangium sp.]